MWNGSKVWMVLGGHTDLAVALSVGEDQEIEIGPEEADEEHHLAGDEQRHAVAQAEPDEGRVQAGRAAFADHVAPPDEHGEQHDQHADHQQGIAAEMRGEDDAEYGAEAADGADDRPGAGIDQVVGLLQARTLHRGDVVHRGAVCVAHANSIIVPTGESAPARWPHHPDIARQFKAPAARAARTALKSSSERPLLAQLDDADGVEQHRQCHQNDDQCDVTAAAAAAHLLGLLGVGRGRILLHAPPASPDQPVHRERGEQHEQIGDRVAERSARRAHRRSG